MVIVPLVITAVISGFVNVGSSAAVGRMGLKTLLYYSITTLMAILTGLLVVTIVEPGVGSNLGLNANVSHLASTTKSFRDILMEMVPNNFLKAAVEGQMVPLIFFCILFASITTQLEDSARETVGSFFTACFEIMMRMTQLIIYLAPIGIFGLFVKLIASTGFSTFIPLAKYSFCVLLALFIHACISLPLIVRFIGNYNPLTLARHMRVPLLTAFSTSSSSATLALTMDAVTTNAKFSKKVASFVLPVGATVNMDGTALYECVAVIFIAQAYGVTLTWSSQLIIVVTSLFASMGAAGIPMAGLVMMSIVLTAVGLPLEGVGLILAVDRVLDMCRTTVNVWSDCCGAAVINHLAREDVEPLTEREKDASV
jgi:Na+/H+-dicarboxylate symporter